MPTLRQTTERQLFRRLLGHLCIIYALFSVDRVNVGFAALQMNRDLGLDPAVYGLGAGIFSLGYILFQVPVIELMRRLGGRRALGFICVAFGLVSAAMAFVWDAKSFIGVRFLLGVAETGFAIYIIYYINLWFPKTSRARAIAVATSSIPIAMAVVSPLSGWILSLGEVAGLASWQWMFLLEGLPAAIAGVLTLFYLQDEPAQARWLTTEQREWLANELARDQSDARANAGQGFAKFRDVLASPVVWVAGTTLFSLVMSASALMYWMPLIIKDMSGYADVQVGFVASVPWLAMLAGMLLNARHSDRTQERVHHVVAGLLIGAVGMCMGALSTSVWMTLLGLLIAAFGMGASQAVFWTMPLAYLNGRAVATGLAVIGVIGNTAGIVTPYVIGVINKTTGSFVSALLLLAGGLVFATLVLLLNFRGGEGAAPTSMSGRVT